MNEANKLYWQAKKYKEQLHQLALDFYYECLRDFEEYAAEGSFSTILYNDDIPDSLQFNFDELVVPLFRKEGFIVKGYIGPRYGYSNDDDGWEISWDLKGENIQYE